MNVGCIMGKDAVIRMEGEMGKAMPSLYNFLLTFTAAADVHM